MKPHTHTFDGSSLLNKCWYAPKDKELTVEFHSGKQYTYEGVSQEAFDAFKNAKSPGQHFGAYIKSQYKVK